MGFNQGYEELDYAPVLVISWSVFMVMVISWSVDENLYLLVVFAAS